MKREMRREDAREHVKLKWQMCSTFESCADVCQMYGYASNHLQTPGSRGAASSTKKKRVSVTAASAELD